MYLGLLSNSWKCPGVGGGASFKGWHYLWKGTVSPQGPERAVLPTAGLQMETLPGTHMVLAYTLGKLQGPPPQT